MRVKPKPGLLVRDPKTLRPLPPEGREVPETPLWQRRLANGDVVRVEEDTPPEVEQHE